MNDLTNYGLITDDPVFAAILSTYCHNEGKYFPIISLPRMSRDDWEIEVQKRVITINRARFEHLFCKAEDYGILAPLRSSINVDLVPLQQPEEISTHMDLELPQDILEIHRDDYLAGLNEAKKGNKRLRINNTISPNLRINNSTEHQSETVVVIEKSDGITDIAAINYALAKGYNTYLIESLSTKRQKEIKELFIRLTKDESQFKDDYRKLCSEISKVLDYKELEKRYERIQFLVLEIPIGLIIESIPVAHLFHLQSELRLMDEFYYLDEQMKNKSLYVPSLLFVDIQSEDLISEIPEINEELNHYKHWRFNLNGTYANRKNFKIYASYFPLDLLFVSGHGSSPNCREVVYRFKSRDGKTHTVKLLEYYQIGEVVEDNVEIETKEYFLEFDGIPWEDKQTLAQKGISHLAREYVMAGNNLDLIEYRKLSPKSIEGLLLFDGIFLGNIRTFSRGNNPIVFFNTCASLLELSKNMSFASARALIGTVWSIYDDDARLFSKTFFKSILVYSVIDSFHNAKQKINRKYSKLSYVCFGTLNVFIPMSTEIESDEVAKTNMGQRLVNSITEAAMHFLQGRLSETELDVLLEMQELPERFVEINLPDDVSLRKNLDKLRLMLDSISNRNRSHD